MIWHLMGRRSVLRCQILVICNEHFGRPWLVQPLLNSSSEMTLRPTCVRCERDSGFQLCPFGLCGCRSPLTVSRCAKLVVSRHRFKGRASVGEVGIIGVDLAKKVFQAAWGGLGPVGRVPQDVVAPAICAVHGEPSGTRRGDGGLPERALLGTRTDWVWPPGPAGRPTLRQTFHQAAKERRGGDRRSRDKADDAVCRAQDRRTAGPSGGVSCPRATREAADRSDQRVARLSL